MTPYTTINITNIYFIYLNSRYLPPPQYILAPVNIYEFLYPFNIANPH